VLGTKHAMVQEDAKETTSASVMESPLEFGVKSAREVNMMRQLD
jgi:hypothetical protein